MAWVTLATVLALGGTVAALLGARAVARSDADHARLAFHLASAEIAASVKQTIQHEEDLVVAAGAFVRGDPRATPAEFDRWTESVYAMQRYPELQNIGLVALVPASRLKAFESRSILPGRRARQWLPLPRTLSSGRSAGDPITAWLWSASRAAAQTSSPQASTTARSRRG